MSRYLRRRLLTLTITFFIALTLNFIIPRAMPGNPVTAIAADLRLPPQSQKALIKLFGLDEPLHVQFYKYVINTLRGEFGVSFDKYPKKVIDLIMERLPWTIFLVGTSTVLSAILGVFLGIESAWRRGSKFDSTVQSLSLAIWAAPAFWLGMLLIITFGYYIPLFPVSSAESAVMYENVYELIVDRLWHSVLPIVTLTLSNFAGYTMIMRSSMLEVLDEDFIVTAYAKGLDDNTIKMRHAARNAMLPVATVIALNMAFVVGGSIFVETVFSYPGVGELIFQSILAHDYPVLQGTFFILTVTVLAANFIADLIYMYLDPRVKYQ